MENRLRITNPLVTLDRKDTYSCLLYTWGSKRGLVYFLSYLSLSPEVPKFEPLFPVEVP